MEHAGPAVVTDLVIRAAQGDKQAWDLLVERYIVLIWSICRRHGLGDAAAAQVSHDVWRQLAGRLDTIRDPAALAGWLATTTRRECQQIPGASRGSPAAGASGIGSACTTERELLAAEGQAALHEAFLALPPRDQELIALLTANPPMPYAQISARLGIPVSSIGPNRGRCLDKLRRDPAIAALIDAAGHPVLCGDRAGSSWRGIRP
jgi:RNA polymerase sigma factor (sigma-70 family)